MKVYVAGKIRGDDNYKEKFKQAERTLSKLGHTVLLPSVLPFGFEQKDYIHICCAMIDVCEAVYFLKDWVNSPGAKEEHEYATQIGLKIMYEQDQI